MFFKNACLESVCSPHTNKILWAVCRNQSINERNSRKFEIGLYHILNWFSLFFSIYRPTSDSAMGHIR